MSDLRTDYGVRLDRLLETALAVEPPGGLTVPWQAILDELQITPLSESERFAEVAETKLVRGAPRSEVTAACHALAEWAIGLGGAAIAAAVTATTEHALAMYTEESGKRPSMFAFAMAQTQSAPTFSQGSHVFRCEGCGAPRLRLDFACQFCGGETKKG